MYNNDDRIWSCHLMCRAYNTFVSVWFSVFCMVIISQISLYILKYNLHDPSLQWEKQVIKKGRLWLWRRYYINYSVRCIILAMLWQVYYQWLLRDFTEWQFLRCQNATCHLVVMLSMSVLLSANELTYYTRVCAEEHW